MLDLSANTPKHPTPPTPDHQPDNPWRNLDSMPKDGTEVELLLENRIDIKRGSWAEDLEDLSGEDLPPFRGVFERKGNYYAELPPIIAWRRIKQP